MPPPARRAASAAQSSKRRADEHDPSISPPPTKRKIQSGTSKTAVASFFTPTSQKPKDRVEWTERAPSSSSPTTLLVARYEPLDKAASSGVTPPGRRQRIKIAAFDLDDTLITTASGKKHATGAADWKWWHSSIPKRLRALHEEGYRLAIFSNQGGIVLHPGDGKGSGSKAAAAARKAGKNNAETARARLAEFRQKCGAVLAQLDLPVMLYAATGKDHFRKPRAGMWREMADDWGLEVGGKSSNDDSDDDDDDKIGKIDLSASFYVGDAAGRPATEKQSGRAAVPKDFSCSDRNFASNVGLAFHTPDEYFLGESPRPFVRTFDLDAHPFAAATTAAAAAETLRKSSTKEVVVFCGPPAAGKSSFFRDCLAPLGYQRVNQDTLKTKEKCLKAATAFLEDGFSVAIDNTNADAATRAIWVALAAKHDAPVRCLWFRTDLAVCEHNDAVRALNDTMNPEQRDALPRIAFNGFSARFQQPHTAEGFAEIVELPFRFRGSQEQYALWGRYWA